jgi:hypothetical protein
MQFDQLQWRAFISLVHCAATHGLPCTSAARHDVAVGGPDRRELLQGLLAAALATAPGWHNDAVAGSLPLERDRFIEISERLCAMSIDDASLADPIQNALADQYGDNDLRRLSELLRSAALQDVDRLVASSGLHRLAKSIVSVWYSGMFGTGEKARMLAYEEALAWRATGYAKAPGTCGEFGDWITEPPSALHRDRRP